jgi:hypothetical protein
LSAASRSVVPWTLSVPRHDEVAPDRAAGGEVERGAAAPLLAPYPAQAASGAAHTRYPPASSYAQTLIS